MYQNNTILNYIQLNEVLDYDPSWKVNHVTKKTKLKYPKKHLTKIK